MKTIATVESITGGMLSSKITSRPNSSTYYKGSIITYANEAKELFGIDTSKGVINSEVALKMAKMGKEKFGVDICISLTGNAGPGALDGQPVGKVFIAMNEKVFECNFKGHRRAVRRKAVKFALDLIEKEING